MNGRQMFARNSTIPPDGMRPLLVHFMWDDDECMSRPQWCCYDNYGITWAYGDTPSEALAAWERDARAARADLHRYAVIDLLHERLGHQDAILQWFFGAAPDGQDRP